MAFMRHLKRYFIPHRGNQYRPHIFLKESVLVLILGLVLVEGVFIGARLALQQQGFLASVLPAALLSLTNTDRVTQSLPELQRDARLDAIAQAKADDMAANGYFAHTSPQGKTPWYWLDLYRYPYIYAGENLAVDFDDAKDVEVAWMNSPTHRENILKPEYTHVGYGIAYGMYQGHMTTFVAQIFATVAVENPAVVEQEPAVPVPLAAASTAPNPGGRVLAAQTAPAAAEVSPESARVTHPAPVAKFAESNNDSLHPATHVAPTSTSAPVLTVESREKIPAHPVVANLSGVLASPRHSAAVLFLSFALLIGLLYIVSMFLHVSNKFLHVEMIAGGAALVVLSIGLVVFNWHGSSVVQLSDNGQAASAAAAF